VFHPTKSSSRDETWVTERRARTQEEVFDGHRQRMVHLTTTTIPGECSQTRA